MNSWFVNPDIILPKTDYVKLVIDPVIILDSFIVGGRHNTYQVGFFGLKPLPSFFSKLMRYALGPLIKR